MAETLFVCRGICDMKVRYIVLAVIVVIMLAVIGIFLYERAHVSFHQTDEGTSISIIGGADGPTSVFLAGKIGGNTEETAETNTEISQVEESEMRMIIGDTEVEVLWENNATVDEIRTAVEEGPTTIEMSMYGGFEQVGSFGRSFTRDDKQTTTSAGDLVLYSGNQLVVFYGSNSWAYTRLGKIKGMSDKELEDLLSKGDVTVSLKMEGRHE